MANARQIPALNGLRAIACLAVFAVHWQQLTKYSAKVGSFDFKLLLENGNTGVCLFFMLSGFLLALPLWTGELAHVSVSPRWAAGYAMRRLARILPAYYVCLTALIIMGRDGGTVDIALHYAFLHNFSEASIYSINDPFWTLAVQAQFYLVIPVLLLLLSPLATHRFLSFNLLIAAAAVTFLVHHFVMKSASPAPGQHVISHSLLAHLPHFLLGMAAAAMYSIMYDPRRAVLGQMLVGEPLFWLSTAGLFCILALPGLDATLRIPQVSSTAIDDAGMIGRYNFPYVPLLLAIIIITAPGTLIARGLLELPPIRSLGVISFGMYVYHLPCLSIVKKWLEKGGGSVTQNPWPLAMYGLLLAMVVSLFSYGLIERPLVKWSRKRSRTVPVPAPSPSGRGLG